VAIWIHTGGAESSMGVLYRTLQSPLRFPKARTI